MPRLNLTRREAAAYIIMILWGVICATVATMASLHTIRNSDLNFCAVITEITTLPITRPADPSHMAAQERQWESWERFVILGHKLGCRGDEYKTVTK
jgi:hypothetical protein